MRARFVIVNAAMLGVGFGFWRAGIFAPAGDFPAVEYMLLGVLALYGLAGFAAGLAGAWETLAFIANGAPMWGLALTGLGMLLAVGDLHSLEPGALVEVFRRLVFSLPPNILAILLMTWLRELRWWCAGEEI
jgi:hypothetical protein